MALIILGNDISDTFFSQPSNFLNSFHQKLDDKFKTQYALLGKSGT